MNFGATVSTMKNQQAYLFIVVLLFGCEAEEATIVNLNPANAPSVDAVNGEEPDGSVEVEDVLEPVSVPDGNSPEGDTGQSGDEDSLESDTGTPVDGDEPAPECEEGDPCNDLDPCTSDDCVDGVCIYSPTPDCCVQDDQCDDGIECTNDTCNAFTNGCEHAPKDNFCCLSDGDCNDFDECSVDLCINNQCIYPQEGIEGCNCQADALCDDNNPCTSEVCQSGVCIYSPASGAGCCDGGECSGSEGMLSLCIYNQCWSGAAACESPEECVPPTACWESDCTANGCAYTLKPNCCQTAFECSDGQEATTDLCIENTCVFSFGESTPCTSDGECASANACSVGVCTEAGVCSVSVSEGEGCCGDPSDCPQPADSCTAATCADFTCGEEPLTGFQPYMTTTFDGDTLEGWTEESNGAGAYWHLSSYQSPEGEGALYYGQDTAINYDVGIAQGSVQSTELPPQTGKAAVRFDRIAHVEPISSRDLFWLDVLQGNQVTEVWNKNDNNGPGLGWKTEVVDVSEVVGETGFRVRFSFDSIDGTKNEYEGLYVDNFSVGILCD